MGLLDAILPRDLLTRLHGPWKVSEATGGWIETGEESTSGVRVTSEDSLSLSAIFCGVNFLSRVIGSLPLSVYKARGESSGRDVAVKHPAHRRLHSVFNPWMTAAVGRRVMEFNRLLFGAGVAEIEWDGGGDVAALWPIEAWRVKPELDEDGDLFYRVDGTRRVAKEDMLYVPLVSGDGTCGQSFVDFAIESLGLGMATQEFAGAFFGNQARPGGMLKHPGSPDKQKRDEIRRGFDSQHAGRSKAFTTGMLWGGWEYERDAGSIDPDKAQLLEQRRFTTEEVARWLGIPPTFLQDLSRATFGNIEEQGINVVVYSFTPVLVDYEQEYDRKLLTPPTVYCKHNVAGLMRGNSAARATYYKELFMLGAYSVNDILELEDRNPVPNGDARFVPANMVLLDSAVAAQAPLPSQAPAPTPALAVALTSIVADTIGRMAAKEINAARRAAAEPAKLFAWMDGFYAAHERQLAEALEPAITALLAASGTVELPAVRAAAIAASLVKRSKDDLLDTSGRANPHKFVDEVERLFNQWAANVPSLAAKIVEEISNAQEAA